MRVTILFSLLIIPVFGQLRLKTNKAKHSGAAMCLLKIAKEQLKTKKLVFIMEDLKESSFEPLVKVNWDRVIISSGNVSAVSGIFVFLPDSNASLSFDKIFKAKHLDYDSVYIICSDSISNIYFFFDIAWEYKVVNAIALFPSSRTNKVSIYTYFPFGSLGCSIIDPVRINVFDPSKNAFQFKQNVFSQKDKLYNLHKCPVRVTVKDKDAQTIMNYDDEGGVDTVSKIFHILEVRLNFTPEVVQVDKEANTYAAAYYNFTSAAVLKIVNGNSDLAVGRFTQLIDDHEDAVTPVQSSMDCFTWAVPMKAGSKPSVWVTSLYEFDLPTWAIFIFSFGLCCFLFRALAASTTYRQPVLTLWGSLLNVSMDMRVPSGLLRLFLAHWLLFSLVMIAAYTSSLGSLVTVPPDSSDIKTTQELLEKDLRLVGEPKMYHILSASSETSKVIKKVLDRFTILRPNEYETIMMEIYEKRSKAVFYTRSRLIQEENRARAALGREDIVHIVPDCLISSFTAPLILRKGSMLLKPVKEIVVRLLETGLLVYWAQIEEEATRSKSTKNETHAFTISQLRGALIVIICGYLLSTAAFLYELYSSKVKFKTTLDKPAAPTECEVKKKTNKMVPTTATSNLVPLPKVKNVPFKWVK